MEILLLLLLALPLGIILYRFFRKKKKIRNDELLKAVKYWQEKPLHDWQPDELTAKRQKTDPVADAIIKSIFASTDPAIINSFYHSIQRTSQLLPDNLPANVKEYFEMGETLPDWSDPILLQHAESFYIEHGGIIALILCAKSLPECYACANGVQVLYRTGRLSEHNGSLDAFTRRVAETAQFIVNTMSPGGLSERGLGIRSAQKVRLIHAAVRHYIHKGNWETEKYGEPINQEDMAGTLMSFAPLVLEGLETLGVKISEADKEAYVHAWRVVGHFMGIDEDLLPNNYADADALGNAIFDKEKAASEEGQMMTKSLIDFMTLTSKNKVMHVIVDDLLRLMMGNETADLLGVPAVSHKQEKIVDKLFVKLLGGWENHLHRHRILRKMLHPLSKLFLNGMLRVMNKGGKIRFFIPPDLKDDWGVE